MIFTEAFPLTHPCSAADLGQSQKIQGNLHHALTAGKCLQLRIIHTLLQGVDIRKAGCAILE